MNRLKLQKWTRVARKIAMAVGNALANKSGRVTERPTLSADEVEALLSAARAHDERQTSAGVFSEVHAKIAALVFSGMREREAVELLWSDLEETTGGGIVARFAGPRKCSVPYRVSCSAKVAALLDEHQARLRTWSIFNVGHPVFASDAGRIFRPGLLREVALAAGITLDLNVHDLRRTFVAMSVPGEPGA